MKKIILLLGTLLVSMSMYAGRPTGFTPGGGAVMDWSKTNSNTETFWGYYVEAGYTYTFSKHSSLYGGLRATEAFKTNVFEVIGKRLNEAYFVDKFYLDIPIKYNFNFDISPKVQMYVNAGPTVDFWLGYTATAVSKGQTETEAKRFNYFQDYPDTFNRVNIGLGGALGVFFHNVKIEVGYDQYLLNSYKLDNIKGARGQLRIGAAYVF